MNHVYIVISIWHGQGQECTFVHGVFGELYTAQVVAKQAEMDLTFVTKKGYDIDTTEELSVRVVSLPFDVMVSNPEYVR